VTLAFLGPTLLPSTFNSGECQGYDEQLSGLDALNTDPTGFLLIGIHIQGQFFV
jgi:hypothetical protein